MMINIVISTMNRPDLLAQCLESVMAQTMNEFNVTVVNDAGESVESVVAPFGPKVSVLNNESNRGQPASLNRGIQAGRGDFIALCDDDDLWAPQHLEELLGAGRSFPQPALFYTDVAAMDATLKNKLGFLKRDFDLATLRETNFIVPSSTLFPREIYDAVGGLDGDLQYYWDWDFFLKVANRFPIRRVAQLLTYYRIHDQSHSRHGMIRQVERQNQLQMLTAEHGLGDLPMRHLCHNFKKTE